MTQQEFDSLTERYLAGLCTPEEVALLEEWAVLHYTENTGGRVFDNEKEENETRERLWKGLKIIPARVLRRSVLAKRMSVAACVVLLLSAGMWYFTKTVPEIESRKAPAPVTAMAANTASSVTLPDGSAVILEEGAEIIADKDFGVKNRRVSLKGEAFFEVKSNPQLPFIVQTEDLVTEVLGTSFRIRPEQDKKKIEVSVVTGKVSVYTAKTKEGRKKDGVIATPNQKVSYDLISKTLRQDLVDMPRPVVEVNSATDFLFDEVPVARVISKIRAVYGVELIAGTPDLLDCVFTGDLNGLEMYRQLDFLCEVIGAKYEVRGTAIFVSGTGCQMTSE